MLTKSDIERFFTADKQMGLLFLVFSAVLVAAALFLLLSQKPPFHRGVSIPLLLLASSLLYAGYPLHSRSDGRRIRSVYAYDMDPGHLSGKELPRLQSDHRNVSRLHMAGFALFGAAVVAGLLLSRRPELAFWYGLSVSFAAVALLVCGLTYLYASRLGTFTHRLQEFLQAKG